MYRSSADNSNYTFRPRIGLKAALIVLSAFCISSGIFKVAYLDPLRKQALIRDRFVTAGFDVEYEVPWFARYIGSGNLYCNVTEIEVFIFQGTLEELSEHYRLLKHLDQLTSLSVYMSSAPSCLFESLPRSGNLKTLAIEDLVDNGFEYGVVPDAKSLESLSELASLRVLRMSASGITDESLPTINKLRELRRLDLSSNAITDSGLSCLRDLNQLNELNLNLTNITGDGLIQFPNYNNITEVTVICSPAGDLDGNWFRHQGFNPPYAGKVTQPPIRKEIEKTPPKPSNDAASP